MLGKRNKSDLEAGRSSMSNDQVDEIAELAIMYESRKRVSSVCLDFSPIAAKQQKEPLTPIIR